ncbi:reverse transcriptase-like [Elysia marginata]|uniref:Reverse transcriptase-like n=1 Tax=Elysia marginata TaxID=1093978 RepID=A0AAV4J1U8_9GAST|nr:reverse transcriptase-like [Elysia marginata]
MYGCEAWTITKEIQKKIEAAEMWFLRRMLRVPWTARKTNEEVLKETETTRVRSHAMSCALIISSDLDRSSVGRTCSERSFTNAVTVVIERIICFSCIHIINSSYFIIIINSSYFIIIIINMSGKIVIIIIITTIIIIVTNVILSIDISNHTNREEKNKNCH